MLRDELKESQPLLPAAASITKGLDGKETTLNTEQLQNIVLKNIKNFKKRALIRINHIFYNNKCFKMLFWLLLLSYPSVSLRVTRYFVCEQIGETYILSFDLYTPCYDLEYSTYGVIAFLGLILYVIGIPVLFITILWRARNNGVAWKLRMCQINKDVESRMLKEAKIDAKLSREHWMDPLTDKDRKKACRQYQQRINFRSHRVYNRLGFIYYAYNEESWWYEVVELSRKVALNGLVALITPGGASQIIAGILVCFIYLFCVTSFGPYKAFSDNFLAILAHLQLFLTLFCGLLVSVGVDFIGKRTIKNPKKRYDAQVDIVQYTVIASHAGLMLYFLIALVFEVYCSKEQIQAKRRVEQEQQLMKKRAAEVAAMKAAASGDTSNQAWLKKANAKKLNSKNNNDEVDHDDILGGFHAALGLDDLSSDSDSEEEEETVVSPINIEPTKQKIVKRKQQEIEDELDNLLTGP